MVRILMMSAKLAAPGLLKIKIFRDKRHDVIIPDYDVTNKILSCDSNDIVDISTVLDLTKETLFLRGDLGLSLIIWD